MMSAQCGTVGAAGVCALEQGHDGPHELRQAQPEPRGDARVLEQARKVAPAAASEYEAARAEMLALADAFGRAMVGTEQEAMHWARGVAGNVCRVARRFALARGELVKAAESPLVIL